MIQMPFRVLARQRPATWGRPPQRLSANHIHADRPCPVCTLPLGSAPVTAVHIGTHPDNQKPAGWTTGIGLCVHAHCAMQEGP